MKKKQLNYGYGCNQHSTYDLNDDTKVWFENLIKKNLSISTITPKFNSESPSQFPDSLISIMNFTKYLIILMLDGVSEDYIDQVKQVSLIELLMLMQKTLTRDLEEDDLSEFVEFKETHDCATCETINICFPKFSIDNRLL